MSLTSAIIMDETFGGINILFSRCIVILTYHSPKIYPLLIALGSGLNPLAGKRIEQLLRVRLQYAGVVPFGYFLFIVVGSLDVLVLQTLSHLGFPAPLGSVEPAFAAAASHHRTPCLTVSA